ncbi:MAG: acyltransferase family protein [Synergistaceae bacterium]|nr:acyltransferase family protein [Synergistaceae bacterium]
MNKDRIIWLDCLRIVACFAVIFAHTASQTFITRDPSSLGWNICNCYDAMCYWANYAFYMLAGIFFLDPEKEIPTSKLYKKYIKKLALVFIFWFFLNNLFFYWFDGKYLVSNTTSTFLREMTLHMTKHLWFLLAIIGFYVSVPIIRCITRNKDILPYFLFVGVLWYFVHFVASSIAQPLSLKLISRLAIPLLHNMIAPCFSFVLGYYLAKCIEKIDVKTEFAWYLLGIAGYLSIVFATAYFSCKEGKTVLKYFSESVLATAVAVFVFFKCRVAKINFSVQAKKAIQFLSSHMLGVYLLHLACLSMVDRYVLPLKSLNLLFSIPLVALVTFLTSLAMAILLKKIPWFNKYFI